MTTANESDADDTDAAADIGLPTTVPELQALVRELQEERRRLRRRARRQRQEIDELTGLRDELNARIATVVSGRADDEHEQLDYLFVATYGRSGSTLLQGILTSIPGYLIRGENGGALHDLFELHTRLLERREHHAQTAYARTAWYGMGGYSADVALPAYRRLVVSMLLRPEADTRVTGFKEIRWPPEDLSSYVDFLRGVFPGARFVINTRDHAEVAESKWWSREPDSRAILAEREEALLRMAEDLGQAAFRVHYNDYVNAPERLAPLFEWLGEPFDLDAVTATMAVQHSY